MMRWVKVGFSTRRNKSYTSISRVGNESAFEINVHRGFTDNGVHIAFPHLLEQRRGSIIFSKCFLPFFWRPSTSRTRLLTAMPCRLKITCLLKESFPFRPWLAKLLLLFPPARVQHSRCSSFRLRSIHPVRMRTPARLAKKNPAAALKLSFCIFFFAILGKCDRIYIFHVSNSLYIKRPEGGAVTLWRHFLENDS